MDNTADLDELIDDEDPIFDQAAEFLKQNHNLLTPDELLELYAYYKQGTEGDCNTTKPGIFQIQSRAKWFAWNQQKGVTKNDARVMYVNKLAEKFPHWQEKLLQPGPAVSRFAMPLEESNSADLTVADLIKTGNSSELQAILKNLGNEINDLDESGMGLIHWCTDRGHANALELLLSHPNLDINLKDSDGQTALHYASSCGHQDCLRILVAAGADKSLMDDDGNTFEDVAFDQGIREFIQNL